MNSLSTILDSIGLAGVVPEHDFTYRLSKGTVLDIVSFSSDMSTMTAKVVELNLDHALAYRNSDKSSSSPLSVGNRISINVNYPLNYISGVEGSIKVREYVFKNFNSKDSSYMETCLILGLDEETIELSPLLINYLNVNNDCRVIIAKEEDSTADYFAVITDSVKGHALKDGKFKDKNLHKLLMDKYVINPFLNNAITNKVYVEVYLPYESQQYPDLPLFKLKVHLNNIRLLVNYNSKANPIRREILSKIESLMYNS